MAKNFIKNKYSKLKEDFNLFGEFLDTPNENLKVDKARLQIKEIIEILPFPMLAMLIIFVYGGGIMKFQNTQDTAWLISGTIFIIIFWFMIQIYYRKKREKK